MAPKRVRKERPHRARLGPSKGRVLTPKEVLARELAGARILGFELKRDAPIDGPAVDFYCKPLKLAIVVERVVRDDLQALRRMERRLRRLQRLGIMVLQFTEEEIVHNLDGVMSAIRRWIRNRPQRWGAPSGSASSQEVVMFPVPMRGSPPRARRSSAS